MLQGGVGEVTGDTSNVFSARLPLVPTLSSSVWPVEGAWGRGGGSGPDPEVGAWECFLFVCLVNCFPALWAEEEKGEMDGWIERRGVSRVVRRQALVLLFDGKSSLRQARIYFKCQDET